MSVRPRSDPLDSAAHGALADWSKLGLGRGPLRQVMGTEGRERKRREGKKGKRRSGGEGREKDKVAYQHIFFPLPALISEVSLHTM